MQVYFATEGRDRGSNQLHGPTNIKTMKALEGHNFFHAVHKAPEDRWVILYYTAAWCGPCRYMRPHMEALDVNVQNNVDVHMVDIDTARDLAMMNNIQAVPTLVAYKGGEIRGSVSGVRSPGDTLKWLSSL